MLAALETSTAAASLEWNRISWPVVPSASKARNVVWREFRKSAMTRATVVLPTPPFSPCVRISRGLSGMLFFSLVFLSVMGAVIELKFLYSGERMRVFRIFLRLPLAAVQELSASRRSEQGQN